MSDDQLVHYISTWEPGTWHRTIAEQELRRRRGKPRRPLPWVVIGACTAAVLAAVAAF